MPSQAARDQRKMEARADILVYSSEPLEAGMEVSGPINVTLYVSSDAKDNDSAAKVIDVYPDVTATTWTRRFKGSVIGTGTKSRQCVDGAEQSIQSDAIANDHQ